MTISERIEAGRREQRVHCYRHPDLEHLAHDRGHRILRLERKGGDRTVLTAPVARRLHDYLDGHTTEPLFITRTGNRMGQPEAGK